MHGQKRNNLFLIVYISLAVLLLVALIFYAFSEQVPTPETYTAHPQVEAYQVEVIVKEVHTASRVLVVDYKDTENMIVGLLPEGKILNSEGEEIDLLQLQKGDVVILEVKFIGTNSILVDEIRVNE
jgi:hypothetical protein